MNEQDKAAIHARLMQLEVGQTNLEVGQASMQTELAVNTRMTTGLQQDVAEVLDILDTAKSGFKVLGVMGTVIKWTASLLAAVGAVWAAFHGGGGIK